MATVASILAAAGDILHDAGFVRWTQAELVRALNYGRREIAIARPDVYAERATVTLTAGYEQTIPADGTRLLDVLHNVTAAGAVGRAVRIVEREELDALQSSWFGGTTSADIRHFSLDERAPRTFEVYPPAASGHKLRIVYSKMPADVGAADTLTSDALYSGALTDYILYRAFLKDAEFANNADRATRHYQAFLSAVGIGGRVTIGTSPNTANEGGAPSKVSA